MNQKTAYNVIEMHHLGMLLNSHNGITVLPRDEAPGKLDRNFKFVVNDHVYRIEWWTNGCYLYAGDLMFRFSDVAISGTWPNNAKRNLQFYDDRGDTVAAIILELYPAHE